MVLPALSGPRRAKQHQASFNAACPIDTAGETSLDAELVAALINQNPDEIALTFGRPCI
jgi:hypothetical protein